MGRTLCSLLLLPSLIFAADVTLQWNANTDADLAGYRIHYGRASGQYQSTVDVGNVLSHTVTGLQENTEYFFALSAYDQLGNESGLSAEISGVPGDNNPPKLLSVQPVDTQELSVGFNEILNKESAETAANYLIDQGVNVKSAKLQGDRKTVLLTTSVHQPGQTYTLRLKNIRDIAIPPNTIADGTGLTYRITPEGSDNTPPTILLARLSAATRLNVFFSEPLDAASASDINNYFINQGIVITHAELDTAGNVVHLVTSEHVAGQNYTLTVNNVRDRSAQKNVIQPNSYYTYAYEPTDQVGPVITLAQAVDVDLVDVMFNEPLDKVSAENPANYSIQSDVQVLSASLDATGQVVHLRTSAHTANRLYVINVRDVSDASAGKNPVATGTSYAYVFVPIDHIGPTITQVEVKDATHISVIFNESLDRNTAEKIGHYRINNDVQVLNATLDVNGRVVDLETTAHIQGRLYVLVVNQVLDATSVGNEILPNSSYAYVVGGDDASVGPTIVRVDVQGATSLVVQFSKEVDRTSAETAAHYRLNRDAAVLAASLDATGRRVTLQTTAHEADKVYILTVSNVTDASVYHNIITPNSAYSYIFEGSDMLGPVITLVKVVDAQHLDILFNEGVDKISAETVTNYIVSGNITVLKAQLDGSHRVVHLQTTAHAPQKLYVLRLNGIKDESSEQNPIEPNSSYAYLYEPADALPPTLALVRVKNPQRLEVAFNESVESTSSLNKSNYVLNHGIEILSVTAGLSGHQVELQVSPLTPGKIYMLVVNNVRDGAGNTIAANSAYAFTYGDVTPEAAPAVTSVQIYAPTQLEISFNVPVDKSSAETADHYSIEGIAVVTARLDPSQMKVTLTTSSHQVGRIYVLLVSHVYRQGRPDLIIQANTPYFYMLPEGQEAAPTILNVVASGETLVDVYFSQPVDQLTAENRRNYHITNDVVVLFAELDELGSKVTLETSRHQAGQVYTLSVSGVRSRSGSATIHSAVTAYTYVPGLQVKILCSAECLLSHLEVGGPYYVDRNYMITQAPEGLIRSHLIMTANNDKSRTDASFMILQLNQATIVYVAYDANAVSAPTWLKNRFMLTQQTLSVSESTTKLALWAAYFPAGRVELGANNAAGAEGAKCMYVVLLQEPAFAQILSSGELESLQQKSKELPQTMVLHHNYPNPFNPRTT
ncbi:Ig-like domain-containing protein, partial [candidate division KSB1 bacterium]|nr:Ig-like domain-containing protein [candidate division KSB1 bacterium]